jgi:hypothetical protein
MRLKRLNISTVILLWFGITGLQAQETVPVTGGNISGNGGSVSYTVGQVFCQTHAGTNGLVDEGIQQPYWISKVTDIEKAKDINLSALVCPNPVKNHLVLIVENVELLALHFQLFDEQGKLLQCEEITDNQTSITMGYLLPSTYFLKVIQGNKELKTFKIIKTP